MPNMIVGDALMFLYILNIPLFDLVMLKLGYIIMQFVLLAQIYMQR